ncbi:hypothetical protein ACPOL_1384 [Acidisarcina polymorpha]|uniref:Uncharacterized protein n=1 Tax=Acidisarcina polymorpha TaxID=2211140 RepID=A0A2Z5FVF2_9BACT|nr:hypothetical protein ACPOL_1384 [Acidisarcina polymorpha]
MGYRCRNIVSGHRLNEHRRQANALAIARSISDTFKKLEELRGADD